MTLISGEAFLREVEEMLRAEGIELPRAKFEPLRANKLKFASSLEWRIKRLLPRVGVVVFYGAPESFKSFIAMNILAAIDASEAWAGLKTERCPVLYIQAEAPGSFAKRIAGVHKAKSTLVSDDFRVITVAPNLGTMKGDLAELIQDIDASAITPGVIVIDTMSASLGCGEENGIGTQLFLANARELSNRFKALVIAIHHPGREGGNPRGHSSIEGNADGIVRFDRVVDQLATTLSVEKLKDEEHNFSLKARLARIVIGHDEDGDEISTLVVTGVEPVSGTSIAPKAKSQRSPERELLTHKIAECYEHLAEVVEKTPGFDAKPVRKVEIDKVRDEVRSRGYLSTEDGKLTATARSHFQRAKADLLASNRFAEKNGLFWRAAPEPAT